MVSYTSHQEQSLSTPVKKDEMARAPLSCVEAGSGRFRVPARLSSSSLPCSECVAFFPF